MNAPHRWLRRLTIAPLLLVLTLYRRLLSPLLPPRCRYHPTCSTYAVEALQTRGLLAGTWLAAWRVVRCNPWSHGGVDPVPARGLRASIGKNTSK